MDSKELAKINKAISTISINYPEIAKFLFTCKFIIASEQDDLKTCSTNCINTITFNRDYLHKKTIKELIFILTHEVYHCILNHLIRIGKRNFKLWNIAADYYINDKLVSDKIGDRPANTLYDIKYKKYSTDAIYNDLLKNSNTVNSSNFDEHIEESDIAEDQSDSTAIKDLLEDILESEKDESFYGDTKKLHKKLSSVKLPTKINWATLLRSNIRSTKYSTLTYNRFNKKNTNIIFQKSSPVVNLSNCYLCIDVSGSISRLDLEKFFSEIMSILKQKCIKKMTLIFFDTVICFEKQYDLEKTIHVSDLLAEIVNIKYGGCGTLFECLFMHIRKKASDYMIVFTDGYPNKSWGTNTSNLIYVVTSNQKSPIGKTISF